MKREPEDELRAVPAAWPAFVALTLLVLLDVAMIGVDVVAGAQTHDRTSYMIDNSLASVVKMGDLRYQAARLQAAREPADISSIIAQIDADLWQYEPLTTEVGERAEYQRLTRLLDDVRRDGPTAPLFASIVASIDHLEEINTHAAYESAEAIRTTQGHELAGDVIVGAITVTLAAMVALVLMRSLRRQRVLLELHLRSLAERHKELEAFAARASHDLKGPLSPLRGYADALADHPSPEVQEVSQRIRRAADRMTGIIDELLALSVHGQLLVGHGRIAEVAREILDELAPELTDADVTLAVGDAVVACSPGVLGQVLRNLLSNAIKYRAIDRRLIVRLEAVSEGGTVTLSISDNGQGMDDHAVAHAFEPLYRAPGASRPGHGLGLSIVKRTVESAGGRVELSSNKGEGTIARVHLPA
jgi:signal transduction histidine kinase